ncbi:MAG: hypothetical protein AMJ78_00810 [Omnitrophica WOR_2 bacterium SM23_29]|nr:MAG: hypothetical protein AMJ78_00810 [Omnitrophica WOR_2 bacterium SM23_29]
MQKSISSQKIREKLSFLKTKLPKQPTAANSLYSLPAEFAENVVRSNYSQVSLQKISDHIGYYLGLLKSVKITFIEEFTDNRWVGTSDGILVGDRTGSPISGLYKIIGFDRSGILLIKKHKYDLKHILAILTHEYTHNYLYHHRISESEESENEILTDLATAYLGLGHLLIPGYKPITWTSNHWNYVFASGYTTHTLSIGYLTPNTIRKAIIISAEIRNWDPEEVIANFSSVWDKIIAYFQLWPYKNRLRKIEREKRKDAIFMKKRVEQINSLKVDVNNIHKVYNQVCKLIKSISTTMDTSSITAEDGRMFVEITNKIFIGEPISEIKSILEKIDSLKTSSINNENIPQLVKQVDELKKMISKWYELLCKYSNNCGTSANSG